MSIAMKFYRPGARDLGRCRQRDCPGRLMLVEDMGDFLECQCSKCLTLWARDVLGGRDREGDAFLGGM